MTDVKRCCSCNAKRSSECRNCVCVKRGKPCTNCCVSLEKACQNPHGCGAALPPREKLICPFERCVAGINGKAYERRKEDITRFRTHVSTHVTEGFKPTDEWLLLNSSKMCPTCKIVIVSLTSRCTECKTSAPEAPSAPRAQHLLR
jgi:hypothetical protein